MLTDDWMLRQVDGLARSLSKLVLKKDSPDYLPTGAKEDAALDALHLRLVELLAAGDVGAGEDLLFQESDWSDLRYLEVAVDFYSGPALRGRLMTWIPRHNGTGHKKAADA